MDLKKYLTGQIRRCRRKMNIAKLLDKGVLFAAAGGILGMVCELVSLFVPFYYVHPAAALCFAVGLLAGLVYGILRRYNMRQAAGRIDSFGLKERMLTAYEQMGEDGEFARLQREDALKHYEAVKATIKIPVLPELRHWLALVVSVAVVIGMSFIPSPVREQAKLTHQVQERAKEEKEELEELLDALESVEMDQLTEEQKEQLNALAEALKLSQEELAKANSWESLASAMGKLDYKYEQASQSLSTLASQMENPMDAGIADAEALAKAAAGDGSQQTASSGTASSGESGNGENGSGEGNGTGESGENGDGDGNSGEGQDGDGDGDGQSGEGNGSGDGNGSGSGNGNGNGSGTGTGNGTGSGNGSGSGRGTGSSDAAHDYVSVPNQTGDDAALTGDKNGDEDSDYVRQQNGLAWEGNHVDYNSVIGSYTDSAYEGIATGKYPTGMENVIRDYFENLNE